MTEYTLLLLAGSLWTSILIVELIRKVRGFKLATGGKRGCTRYTLNEITRPAVSSESLNPVANKKTSLEEHELEYLL